MEARKRIPPLYNDMFLRVFGAEASKGAALALANAVLRAVGAPPLERVDEISADRTVPGGAVLKSPRLDVVLRCENRFVDLEAQARRTDIHNKAVYYASRLVAAHAGKGSDARYARIPEVAVIMLLDGPETFAGRDYLTVGRIHWEREGGCAPGRGNPLFVVIEMAKFRRVYTELTEEVLRDELAAWLYLLARGYGDEGEVARMAEKIDGVEDFAREYGYALDDPNLTRYFDLWVESQMEWNSAIDYARDEGMQQGLERGRERGLAEAAAKLRDLGVSEDIISQLGD